MARLVPPLTLAWIVATFAAGISLERLWDVELGTPLPPVLFNVAEEVSLGWALLAVVVLVGGVAAAPALLRLRPWAFAGAVTAVALAVRLAVNATRSGPEGWNDPFDESFEAKNEYPQALPALEDGVRFFLDRFDELVPALPPHPAGHPPGLLLVLHWLGIDSPNGVTALLIAAGILAVPLTYAVARRILDEERARMATLLSAFASGTTLYGVTSGDALFATLGTAAAALLLTSPRVAATAGAAVVAIGAFFSYALPATAVWALLTRAGPGARHLNIAVPDTFTLRGQARSREGVRHVVGIAVACGAAVAGFYGVLYVVAGFELPEVLASTEDVYRAGVAGDRPYAFWVFGSPAAFLAFMGLPITWYLARAVAERHVAALALVAVLVVSAVGGFTKAETERIWLMYVPLACVAAATVLPRAKLPLVLGLLALQSLAVELIFGTVW